jgi:hypothetical protein
LLLSTCLITVLVLVVAGCGGKRADGTAVGTPTPTIAQLPITRSTPVASAPATGDEATQGNAAEEESSGTASESPAPADSQTDATETPAPSASTNPSSNIPPPSPPPNVQFGLVKGAPPGQTANVMVQTTPKTECTLEFVGPDGSESTADGLGAATTDKQGRAYWEWKIDPQSPAGTGTATATCNEVSVSVPVRVGGVG